MSISRDSISNVLQQSVYEADADTASRGDSKEYWVTRVVRQMQGCSPSKIDSVIQANLPKREIRWSQCPDTLCIPGLEGRLPYDTDFLRFEPDYGFFNKSPWLHPELSVHQYRVSPELLTQAQPYYDFLLALVILCLVILSGQISRARKFLQARIKDFFYTSNERARDDSKDVLPLMVMPVVYFLLCVAGGIFALSFAGSVCDLFFCSIPLYGLFAVYAGLFALMFLSKRLLSAFINWIFFDREDRRLWRMDYNFLLIIETSALMPVAAAAVCFNMPANTVMWIGFILVAAAKLLLLYKTYAIFLPHFYCFLHLLSYLCALEIMPCLALWITLRSLTDYLIITF